MSLARRPAAARAPKRTQSELIRETLADRIVYGILRPGDPLDETALAAEFGVSRTPVREAIRQLEANGFALSRPHCGAVVASFTPEELEAVFVVMAELEALCARLCASAMSRAELDAFALLHQSGAAHLEASAIDSYRAHNERFHNAIYAGSHNGFLEETTRNVRRRLAPFRNRQFDVRHRIDASQREHGLIVAAILEGDGDDAAARMRNHILQVRKTVGQAQDSPPNNNQLVEELVLRPRS